MEKILEHDEFRFEPSLTPEVDNDFLVTKDSEQPWELPKHSSKSPSTQNESFKSPGEFFARRSARLEELEKSPSSTQSTSNESHSNGDFNKSIGKISMQNSFEKYMSDQNFYQVLAEESVFRSPPADNAHFNNSSRRSNKEEFKFENINEPEQNPSGTSNDYDDTSFLDDINSTNLEKCFLQKDNFHLVLPPIIVGTRKLIQVYIENSSNTSSFTLSQQV